MSDPGTGFIGSEIGNWRLLGLLGEGTFGAVYEAENQLIEGRHAAIKVLHPHMTVRAEVKQRFLNEASAASRADHENIIQVFDGGITKDGVCYVVMERLKGRSLAQLIREGRLPPGRAVHIALQVASALGAAHALDIVHRDLKPENIFIVPRRADPEFVKVLDFGIAKLRGHQAQTQDGMWLGTPCCMSPEQWQMLADIDGRADLYALGVILFECLTGRLPFRGDTPYDWLTAHLTHPVPDPAQLAPMPPLLAGLVRRLLAKQRTERPATASDVMAELQRSLDAAGEATPRAGEVPRIAVASQEVPGAPEAERRPSTLRGGTGELLLPPRPPRRRLPLVGGGLALLGLVGGALWLTGGPAPRRPAPPSAAITLPLPLPAPPRRAAPLLPPELAALGPAQTGARFALGKHEVTMAEYRRFALAVHLPPPLPWDGVGDFEAIAALPVNLVSRDEAAAYCRWKYVLAGGRLPDEAEWALAARGGDGTRRFPWGDRPDPGRVNAGARRPALMPVHALPAGATPQGIQHLLGNVAEWTASVEERAGKGTRAVLRGGGANSALGDAATGRALLAPESRLPFVGFRCAASLPRQEQP